MHMRPILNYTNSCLRSLAGSTNCKSSANAQLAPGMLIDCFRSRELIYITKNVGPSTEPWMTPEVTGAALDLQTSMTTRCDLQDRKLLIHCSDKLCSCRVLSESSNNECGTFSKACLKSKLIMSKASFWFVKSAITASHDRRFDTVKRQKQNPCWHGDRGWTSAMCSWSCNLTIFFKFFSKT